MNILISSLGLKAEIVEEALGLFNFSVFDFYANSIAYEQIDATRLAMGLSSGHSVDEVWLVATDKLHKGSFNSAREDFSILEDTCNKYDVRYRLFLLRGVEDINSDSDARAYHDLALRVVDKAHKSKNGGKVFISLACGRKTMSADMQDAAYCLGCDGIIHVLGDNANESFPFSLGPTLANESIKITDNDLGDDNIVEVVPGDQTLRSVEEQKKRSQHFFMTYYLNNEDRNNFHVLYTLPPSKIEALKKEHIGINPSKEADELKYLQRLPKTELHCHLGGALSVPQMIEVAKCYRELIESERTNNVKYRQWLDMLPQMRESPMNWKQWYNSTASELGVHKGLIVAPYLLQFEGRANVLESLIYHNYPDECSMRSIRIGEYERLGDLQGSALLCNEQAIRMTVRLLLESSIAQNVKYIEVRCSPLNYVTSSLSGEQVMLAILEELDSKSKDIQSSVIIIASRHSEMTVIEKSKQLVQRMNTIPLFQKYFRGFDLAGAEEANEARNFRESFLDIMRDCQNITIHAGEDVSSESIWQAVYHLNAERIGHGLSLIDNNELINKFLDRSIGIEMCPSSNYQIVGFRDNYYPETYSMRQYPLKFYLTKELQVSINTDDPGISRTNISKELLKAARMTDNGLTKWEILQLLCNGFRTAFLPHANRKQLIAEAEASLAKLIDLDLL